MRLLGNVGLDDFIGDVAATTTKVAPCPDMTAPKALAHVRKFPQETIGAFPFHPLDQPTDGDMRRDRDHHMDMIGRDVALEDIDAGLLALFPDDSTHSFGDLTAQYFVAVLGNPDDMEVDGKCRMGAMAIVTHVPQST
jgi:hypothetical protein